MAAVDPERRAPDIFPVLPLLLYGTPLGVLEVLFDEAPIHITIHSAALDAAPHDILAALRLRLPTDAESQPQPVAEPVEELVLELSDPRIVTRADAAANPMLISLLAAPGLRIS